MSKLYFPMAFTIARIAHHGQVDKGGSDFIYHPLSVAAKFEDDIRKSIAILHDVVEDNPGVEIGDLVILGFPKDIIAGVFALTKQDGEEYFDYIDRVKKSPVATEIKIQDILHNLDASRMPDGIISDSMMNRYKKALVVLGYEEGN